MRAWIIRFLKGYPDIDSAIEAIREKDPKEKNTILSLAVKRLFNTIGAEDILRENEISQWFFMGKQLSEAEKRLLTTESKQIVESKTWAILQADLKYQANKKMFLLAENEMQVATGKLWTYMLDCFKTRLESMSEGRGLFNTK